MSLSRYPRTCSSILPPMNGTFTLTLTLHAYVQPPSIGIDAIVAADDCRRRAQVGAPRSRQCTGVVRRLSPRCRPA